MSSAAIAPAHAGWPARLGSRAAARLRAASARIKAPASLRRLAEMPLFVAGLGCIDTAAFVGNTIAGLAVTGLSLIGLEIAIADDE